MENDPIKILMIEDDVMDQKAFERFLDAHEYAIECEFAASLREGRKRLETSDFDTVLVDYRLGDGTALDFLEEYRKSPVIVITGMGNEETAIQAMRLGAADYLIKDVHSNYLKVIPVTIENVTQRWRDLQLQNLLSHTVRSMSDGVFITDMNDTVIFANQAFCDIYRYDSEEILGRTSHSIWKNPSDNTQSMEFIQNRITVDWNGEVDHVRKDGDVFPALVSRSAVRDETGAMVAVVGISRDISEQKAVEMEREHLLADIQSTLERFQKLRSAVPVNCESNTLEGIRKYWKTIERFLEDTSDSGTSRNAGGNGPKR